MRAVPARAVCQRVRPGFGRVWHDPGIVCHECDRFRAGQSQTAIAAIFTNVGTTLVQRLLAAAPDSHAADCARQGCLAATG